MDSNKHVMLAYLWHPARIQWMDQRVCVTHRKRAFSAPKICTVLAGYLARLVRLPAWLIRRAPTISPIRADRLGATGEGRETSSRAAMASSQVSIAHTCMRTATPMMAAA